jgi:hypothetical protein
MYVFPTNYELNFILPALIARMSEGRVGLQIMPIRDVRPRRSSGNSRTIISASSSSAVGRVSDVRQAHWVEALCV